MYKFYHEQTNLEIKITLLLILQKVVTSQVSGAAPLPDNLLEKQYRQHKIDCNM